MTRGPSSTSRSRRVLPGECSRNRSRRLQHHEFFSPFSLFKRQFVLRGDRWRFRWGRRQKLVELNRACPAVLRPAGRALRCKSSSRQSRSCGLSASIAHASDKPEPYRWKSGTGTLEIFTLKRLLTAARGSDTA
jgi:hypothetical protein